MGTFPTSSHKVDKVVNERMTLNGKNKDAGVVIREAGTWVMVTTILLMAGLQGVPSHVPFAGAGHLCQNFIRSFDFSTQNQPCRRALFTIEFARYQISSERLQLPKGSFLADVEGFFHSLILASCLFTDIL